MACDEAFEHAAEQEGAGAFEGEVVDFHLQLDAATEGQAFYEGEGFARTTLTVEPGVGHEDYDFPAILADTLPAAERSAR